MAIYDVIILTDSRYINPEVVDQYIQNVLDEDGLVQKALEDKGLKVDRRDWADDDFNWATTSSVLFRTTWDYFDRFSEFNSWLSDISSKTLLINSQELINWNIDKRYLDELGRKNIRVVPTRYIDGGTELSLEKIHQIAGWTDTVIKPTIGGAGRHTYHIQPENLRSVANKLKDVMAVEDFMLQPFQHSVVTDGEWSYMFFGERFSHAVLKKAKDGDYRVQDDFGGTVHDYKPREFEIEFAKAAIQACPEIPAYSRVDVIQDNDGHLAVSELELIEPELWFRHNPESAHLLAGEVYQRLQR